MVDPVQKFAEDVAAIGDSIEHLRMAAEMNLETVRKQQREIARLQRIENAALRVASSRRLSQWSQSRIVDDQRVLDELDKALEATS